MNNSFDIHRFWKLVLHDVRRCSPRISPFGSSLIFMLWFVPGMVLINGVTGQLNGAGYRIIMAVFMSLFVCRLS